MGIRRRRRDTGHDGGGDAPGRGLGAEFAEVAAGMEPDDPARPLALAAADVGYLVTEDNRHLFSEPEVEAFLAAAARHVSEAEPAAPAGGDPEALVRGALRDAVARTVAEGAPDAGREVAEQLARADAEAAAAGIDDTAPGTTLAVATLVTWLVGAHERTGDAALADAASAWVSERAGAVPGLRRGADLLRPLPAGVPVEEAVEDLLGDLDDATGDDAVGVLVGLAAGVVAVRGEGDVAWLATPEGPARGSGPAPQ